VAEEKMRPGRLPLPPPVRISDFGLVWRQMSYIQKTERMLVYFPAGWHQCCVFLHALTLLFVRSLLYA